jgi:hypothetical protein
MSDIPPDIEIREARLSQRFRFRSRPFRIHGTSLLAEAGELIQPVSVNNSRRRSV